MLHVTTDNFEKEVLNNPKIVVLDFWASWCGPCRMLAPIIEELAQERAEFAFGKVNVDEEMELAQKFGIESIPTLIFMKDGRALGKTVGYMDKNALNDVLNKLSQEVRS